MRNLIITAAFCAGIWIVTSADGESSPVSAATPNAQANTNSILALEQVIHEALTCNAGIKAARANWEAAKQRVPQARAWEDLHASFDTLAGRFVSISPNSFTDQKLMAEQPIPLSGKNRLRGAAAEADACAVYGELRRHEFDVVSRAKTAYYRLANACQQLNINDKNTRLLNRFVEISRAKFEAGTNPESDVLIAQTAMAKLHEDRADILRQISDAESQLNVAMNRSAECPLPHPAEVLPPTVNLELQAVETMALTNRPELLVAQKKIESATAKLTAARREWIPDPSIRLEASRYNGADEPVSELMAGVSINIPWINRGKYKAAIEEARQMKVAAEFELESAQKETLGAVRDSVKKVETYHHHVELFRDRLLPLAQRNVTAARLAYETDKSGFLNLIDAQRTLQDTEMMYWNHLTDFLMGLAELEALIGAQPNGITPGEHPTNHHHQ